MEMLSLKYQSKALCKYQPSSFDKMRFFLGGGGRGHGGGGFSFTWNITTPAEQRKLTEMRSSIEQRNINMYGRFSRRRPANMTDELINMTKYVASLNFLFFYT